MRKLLYFTVIILVSSAICSCSPKTIFVFDSMAVAEYDRSTGTYRLSWHVKTNKVPIVLDSLRTDTSNVNGFSPSM